MKLDEIRDELADKALEDEIYEGRSGGFLEKPYKNRYRFHDGFIIGYDAAMERVKPLVEALEDIITCLTLDRLDFEKLRTMEFRNFNVHDLDTGFIIVKSALAKFRGENIDATK